MVRLVGCRLSFSSAVSNGDASDPSNITVGDLYETALYEWSLTPEYINDIWTEELLQVMFEARLRRIKLAYARPEVAQSDGKISNEEFLLKIGKKYKRL